jgi:hypothetical protein
MASVPFPGGEPDGPSVRTAVPGPKSLAQQAELASFQDAAGVKFFGACMGHAPVLVVSLPVRKLSRTASASCVWCAVW